MAFKKKSKDDNVVDLRPQSGAGGTVTTVVESREDVVHVDGPAANGASTVSTPSSPSTNGSAPSVRTSVSATN